MRSNLTILEQNTLAGFEHDDTQELYLRGAQKNEMKAFKMAYEWQDYLRAIRPMVEFAANQHKDNPHIVNSPEKVTEDVMNFIKERQFRRYFPNQ
jgi:hypothetical protein